MRRLPLTFTAMLVLSCGDDLPDQEPTGSSGAPTGADTGSSTGSGITTDPPTTTTTTNPTTGVDSSTGPVEGCGNRVIEGDEECDDGNTEDDDACYSDCTIPFEILWTQTHHGDGTDSASDVVFDGEGNIYVLGNSTIEGNRDLWLRQYSPDGREGWTYTHAGPIGGSDFGSRLAWHQSGDLLLVGTETTENDEDILVIRLGIEDQTPVWMDVHDGPGLGPGSLDDVDNGIAIAGAANGDVLVVGAERVDDQEFDTWVRRYDEAGTPIWTQTFNGAFSGSDTPDAVLEDAAGNVYVVGNTEVTQSVQEGWVRKYDAKGLEMWTETVTDVLFSNARLDTEGNLVIVGLDVDNSANINMWAGTFDADFTPMATVEYDGPSGFDSARGVAVDAGGDVYMSGLITNDGEQGDAWVGRYDPSLQSRRWSHSYGNEESHLNDAGNAVAVNDDGSRLVMVGFEAVLGEDLNIWVRMFQNNPAPQ